MMEEDITPEKSLALIRDNKDNMDFVVLDVRTPEEFAEGHIEDAVNLDFSSRAFSEGLNKLDRDKRYVVYCQSGRRGKKTLNKMRELEFKEVYNLLGGIKGWEKEGLPTVR
ncbi:MAG: rhodanese-like domain-containing protein [Planctomycetota bacterium]